MNRLSLCLSVVLFVSPGSLPAHQNVTTQQYSTAADTPTPPACENPQLLKKVKPVLDFDMPYDRQALYAHIKGPVSYIVEISSGGSVSRVTLIRGNPTLTRAAARAVRQWRYAPLKNTCTVSVTLDVGDDRTSRAANILEFPADDDWLQQEQPKRH